jgi:Protein of unknown function (DUF1077)
MGNSPGARQAAAYAIDNVIYEWEFFTGLLRLRPRSELGPADCLQVFSIMMVAMLFKGPLQAIAATNSTFTKLETEGNKGKMILVKATFIAMQCMLLALGVWKIGKMGLLPTTQSDWMAFESERICLEKAYFAT